MGALVTKEAVAGPATALRMLARLPAGARYALSPRSAKNAARTAYPLRLTVNELIGLLLGPLALAGSCLRAGWLRRRADGRDTGGTDD
jgi:hypothetical protein